MEPWSPVVPPRRQVFVDIVFPSAPWSRLYPDEVNWPFSTSQLFAPVPFPMIVFWKLTEPRKFWWTSAPSCLSTAETVLPAIVDPLIGEGPAPRVAEVDPAAIGGRRRAGRAGGGRAVTADGDAVEGEVVGADRVVIDSAAEGQRIPPGATSALAEFPLIVLAVIVSTSSLRIAPLASADVIPLAVELLPAIVLWVMLKFPSLRIAAPPVCAWASVEVAEMELLLIVELSTFSVPPFALKTPPPWAKMKPLPDARDRVAGHDVVLERERAGEAGRPVRNPAGPVRDLQARDGDAAAHTGVDVEDPVTATRSLAMDVEVPDGGPVMDMLVVICGSALPRVI